MRKLDYQHGLTLIELLVTMVLLGFVVALMSGAFVQIAQMLRISSEHGNGFSGRWTQSRSMQDLVSNMVPDPAYEIPLVGKATVMTLTTLALPPHAKGVAQRATLSLNTNAFAAGTEETTALQVNPGNDVLIDSGKLLFEIARYKGRLIFVYVDASGREYRQWPPSGTIQTDKLPSAIGLRDESQQNRLVLIANYEGILSTKRGGGLEGLFGVSR
jgi:general secretion pathway protein J